MNPWGGAVNNPAGHPERMTQKEFAALIGCSAPMVTKHKDAGRLVMEGRLVCVSESLARIEAWKDPARGGDRTGRSLEPSAVSAGASSTDPDRLNYNAQAAREKLAAAQLRELELAREAGDLVLKSERDDAEFGRARAGREAILSIPDRLATRLAPLTDAADIHEILLKECRRVCKLLASLPDAGEQPEAQETEAA